MHLTVYAFHALPGKTEATLSLFREWQQLLASWHPLSTELFINPQDPADMAMAARFSSEEAAWSAVESPQHCAWYARLTAAAESGLVVKDYQEASAGRLRNPCRDFSRLTSPPNTPS